MCAGGFKVWETRPSCRLVLRRKISEWPATGFARRYDLSLHSKTGSLASPNCRSSLNGLSLRGPTEAFDHPALVRPRGSAEMVPSRASVPAIERRSLPGGNSSSDRLSPKGGRNEVVFEIGPRGPHRRGVRGLRSSAQSGGLVALLFLPIGGFPRPSSRKPARAVAYSFSRLLLRSLPAALCLRSALFRG